MSENAAKTLSASTQKTASRRDFLQSCAPETVTIHTPLLDPFSTRGHPNPSGLGEAEHFSKSGSWGQSSVLFADMASYCQADENGCSPYGGAEYGIPLTPEADAVCRKMADLHGGAGAIICPSGLSAITTTIEAFAPRALLIPDNVYVPLVRFLKRRNIRMFRYPAGASSGAVAAMLQQAHAADYSARDLLLYIEAPGSGTFEIPDIAGIMALARAEGIRTAMDNTWASHVRCRPIEHGVDLVIQATTKYEGGYGDTPSGVVIARDPADFAQLAAELRASGNGAVAPTTCARLLRRLDSAASRLNRHTQSALSLAHWFLQQDFVADVLSPALESSPYHARFQQYFGQGNSLFSVVFKHTVSAQQVAAFSDALNLFWVAESWGGHVSLVLPVSALRECAPQPQGEILRFHAGLEDARDLLHDLNRATRQVFAGAPESDLLAQGNQ